MRTPEDQLASYISDQLSAELDWEVVSDVMCRSCGWTRIKLSPFISNQQAVDIRIWIEDNRTGHIRSRGNVWLFEKSKDATIFVLKWS